MLLKSEWYIINQQYGWILHSCAVFSLASGSWKYCEIWIQAPFEFKYGHTLGAISSRIAFSLINQASPYYRNGKSRMFTDYTSYKPSTKHVFSESSFVGESSAWYHNRLLRCNFGTLSSKHPVLLCTSWSMCWTSSKVTSLNSWYLNRIVIVPWGYVIKLHTWEFPIATFPRHK